MERRGGRSGRGSSRGKPGSRAFTKAGCLQDTSPLFLKETGWGAGSAVPEFPEKRAPPSHPFSGPPSCPPRDSEGTPEPGCWEEQAPPLRTPAGSSPPTPPQLCPRAQGGVGTEPRAPAHWPSSNLPGDDRLRYLMRTRMRTPHKNKKTNPTRPANLTAVVWPARLSWGLTSLDSG